MCYQVFETYMYEMNVHVEEYQIIFMSSEFLC